MDNSIEALQKRVDFWQAKEDDGGSPTSARKLEAHTAALKAALAEEVSEPEVEETVEAEPEEAEVESEETEEEAEAGEEE